MVYIYTHKHTRHDGFLKSEKGFVLKGILESNFWEASEKHFLGGALTKSNDS